MTELQELLNKEASLSNRHYLVVKQIKAMRGSTPPDCWGTDDCSTQCMVTCPWRVDCNSYEAEKWQQKMQQKSPMK